MTINVTTPYSRELDLDTDCRGLDLKHTSFAGLELRDYDFRGADLRAADFTGALLINCRFDSDATDIRAAIFAGARVLNGHFEGAQAQRSVWTSVTAARCRFDNTDLTLADFGMDSAGHRSNLFASNFGGAILDRTKFVGAILRNAVADATTVVKEISTAGADVNGCGFVDRRARPALREVV